MPGKSKQRVLEADRLIIGDPEGARTEITAERLWMYGADGKLRLSAESEEDGCVLGLFTSECDGQLDAVAYIGASGRSSHAVLGHVGEDGCPQWQVEIRTTEDLPQLVMFDRNLDTIFEVPEDGPHTLEDELSAKIAETVAQFVRTRGGGDDLVRAALEFAPGKLRRLREMDGGQ